MRLLLLLLLLLMLLVVVFFITLSSHVLWFVAALHLLVHPMARSVGKE